jgi:hypothetical protein
MQMDNQCLFFTYHVTANQCYLKAGLGTSVASLEPYYISGPKYCGFSSGDFSLIEKFDLNNWTVSP